MDPRHLAAVLVAPHKTLWVEAESEAELLERLAKVGPVPQADLFEPWDPGDPWRARVLVPSADPAACLSVGELETGNSPGRTEWIDTGRVGEDRIEINGAIATCTFDHEGGLLFPDLIETDEPTATVLHGFTAGVGGKSAVWVQAIRHRDSGRPGYRFTAEVPDREPMEERRAVFEAVLSCGEPVAPDLIWWFELGRVVVVAWRLHPPIAPLPADAGFVPFPPLAEWQGRTELQVRLPLSTHDADALVLGEQLGERGYIGARPRWIGSQFIAVWEGERGVDLALDHRRVPGCPPGLEERWFGIDPRWWPGLVRYRCGLEDRDLLPVCTSREADPIDDELIALFGGWLGLDPVQADVPALRIVMPTLDARSWALWVERFAAVEHPKLASVHYVAMGQQTTLLLRRLGEHQEVRWARSG